MENLTTPDATRRDGVDVYPILLADNRSWGFARATTRLVPVINLDVDPFGRVAETIAARTELSYPRSIGTLIDRLGSVAPESSIESRHEAFVGLAVELLRLAHDIGQGAARSLLTVDQSDIRRLVYEVLAVATGGESRPRPGIFQG